MKKSMKIMMAIALTMVTLGANAQFGVKLGYSNLSQKIESSGVSINPGSLSGFTAGAFYDIQFPVRGLSIRPGLNYTFGSGKFLSDFLGSSLGDASITQVEHMIGVPIDFKYAYGFTDDFKVYAFAGPKFAIGLSSIFKMSEDGETIKQNNFTGKITEDGETEDGEGGMFSRFDVRIGIGAGVQFRSLLLEVGYDWGMLNRLKSDYTDNVTWKMGQLFVGVGLMF